MISEKHSGRESHSKKTKTMTKFNWNSECWHKVSLCWCFKCQKDEESSCCHWMSDGQPPLISVWFGATTSSALEFSALSLTNMSDTVEENYGSRIVVEFVPCTYQADQALFACWVFVGILLWDWDVTTKWVLPAAGHWAFTSLLREQFKQIIWFESEAWLCFNKCGYGHYLFRRMCGLILPKWDLFIAGMTRKALPAV